MELDKWLQKYDKKFTDGFPTIPLGWGRSEEELIDIIKRCLEQDKDVYELGYLDEMDGVDY